MVQNHYLVLVKAGPEMALLLSILKGGKECLKEYL
jgi:hypothetical protein